MPSVLFFTAYPIEDASCRYRVHQFVPYLERAGYKCEVSSFCSPDLFAALKEKGRFALKLREMLHCSAKRLLCLRDISSFDAIVIHREAFPLLAPVVENSVLRRHTKVIFSFDDAIYAGHEEVAGLSHPVLYRWKHGAGYDEVIRRSAHVIVGNSILAEYARQFNRKLSVIPTVVDCRKFQFRLPCDARPVTIGWMGSRSTAPYLALVAPALRRLASAFAGRVHFRFVGAPGHQPRVPNSYSAPFVLGREIEELRSFDIGIMPLPDTEWTRGKCAFKAIQYMASGVPVVASPVGITSDLVQHNANGLMAAGEEDWFCELARLAFDVNLRRRLALAGRKTIEESYSLERWGPRMVEIFDRLLGRRAREHESVAA